MSLCLEQALSYGLRGMGPVSQREGRGFLYRRVQPKESQ